jgi:hypothetical protein
MMNVIISFPFGIASFLLLLAGKKIEGRTSRFRTVEYILIGGSAVSLVVLIGYLIFD